MLYQNLKTFFVPLGFRGKNKVIVQLWWVTQSTIFSLSPRFMDSWRGFLLRSFGAKIGKNVTIRPSAKVQFPWKLIIGDYSWIGEDVILYSLGNIYIGSNVVISQKGYLCAGSHDYLKSNFPITQKSIIIEDECWLATDVYVAPGITIGRGTVVGARSSVFKSLPSGKICLGSPARPIKDRI